MSHLEDDGGLSSDFIAVETPATDATGRVVSHQSLWFAVRHGYRGNAPEGPPIVQILYQEKHMDSMLVGPVFLDIDTWRAVNRAVEKRLKAHEKRRAWLKWQLNSKTSMIRLALRRR